MSPAVSALTRLEAAERVRLLIVLAGLSAFGPLTTDVYLPGLPNMTNSLGASPVGAQLTLTSCVIGLGIGQLFVGPLSDMLGRRRPLLAGLGAFVIASVACAAAPSLGVLIASRLLQGLSGGAGIVIARAMVRDLHSGIEAGRTFSTLSAIVTSALIFGPLVGAALLVLTNWRGLFVALAAIGLALLAAAALGTEETLPSEYRQTRAVRGALHNVKTLLHNRHYMAYALPGALGFGAIFAYISASSFVYQEVFGTSAQLYSVLFSINGVALMSSNLTNRRLVGRISQVGLFVGGLIVVSVAATAILVAVVAEAGAIVVLPLLLIVAGGTGFVVPNSVTLAMEGEAARAGAASALLGLLQFTVGALVAPLVGLSGASAVPMGVVMATSALLALGSYFVLAQVSAPAMRSTG